MRQHSAGQSTKQRKAARVSNFLLRGALPVKDLCGIILDYSQHFEGEPSLILNGHTNSVSALAVMPDGKLASGSGDKTVRVWDPTSGECLLTLSLAADVACMTVLKDGRLAVGLADRTICMWE